MEKEKKVCGLRWMAVETSAFSSIKRMFDGEYTSSTKFQIGKRYDNEDITISSV